MHAMKIFLATLALVFSVNAHALAAVVESTESDDLLNAVDEVTGTITTNGETNLTVFVNGTYSATAVLQREKGSPGSGAWENVLTVTNGTDDATVVSKWTSGPNSEAYRVKMTARSSGAVVAQLTDGAETPQAFSGDAYVAHEDDFFTNTGTIDAAFYVTAENDATGTVCVVTPTIQEGGVTCVSGTGDDGADEVAFSLIDLTDDGALVSDGWTAVEWNIQIDQVDGQSGFCLHDEEATASQLAPFDVDSNVVTFDTANQANSICIMQQGEADDTDGWHTVSANADAEGNNSDEFEVNGGAAISVDTYYRLRIEIDSTGDAYFYVDGALVHAENEAVATTARLIPFAWVNTTAAAPGATTAIVDQLKFVMSRPNA